MLDIKIFESKVKNAISYTEYMDKFKLLAEKESLNNNTDQPDSNKLRLNYQRSLRIHKTYKVDINLCRKINRINKPLIWMAITEEWCGDSAQTLPYFAALAMCNELMDFRIIERDKNPDIMDNYLTNETSRSIPKIVVFDYEGNELFQWGPRPKMAQEIVDKAKAEGKTKEEFLHKLHLWYAQDKGKEMEKELHELLENLLVYSSDLKGK